MVRPLVDPTWDKQVLTITPNCDRRFSFSRRYLCSRLPRSTSTSHSSSSLLHILHSLRLPRELVRHEQPPRVFVVFLDALSPACVSRAVRLLPRLHLSLLE
jgi:hypothetical protein